MSGNEISKRLITILFAGAGVDWIGSFSTACSIDQMYEMFIAILNHTIEMFVPMRMVVANRTNLPSYLRNMSMYRDGLWERAHCSTNNNLWQEYTDYTLKFT